MFRLGCREVGSGAPRGVPGPEEPLLVRGAGSRHESLGAGSLMNPRLMVAP